MDPTRRQRGASTTDSRPQASSAELEAQRFIGTTLVGQYQIVESIGAGAMGMVFRARQLAVGRDVAVKIMHRRLARDDDAFKRFENEARVISRLRHPNTLRLYDCQRTPENDFFIVTELLSGRSFQAVLREEGKLSCARAIALIDQVCRSLAEAHEAGIVHRDLKPDNVFLDRVGPEDVVKVLDFGIAKLVDDSVAPITRNGVVFGTPRYMSPEQVKGEPTDRRSDIYALGIMFYQLLAGEPPFNGAIAKVLRDQAYTPPVPPSARQPPVEVPRHIEALILSMLEKRPEDRPQSVLEVRERLVAPVAAAVVAPPPPTIVVGRPLTEDLVPTAPHVPLGADTPVRARPRTGWLVVAIAALLTMLAAAIIADHVLNPVVEILVEPPPVPVEPPDPPEPEVPVVAPVIAEPEPVAAPDPPPVRRPQRVRPAPAPAPKREASPSKLLPVDLD